VIQNVLIMEWNLDSILEALPSLTSECPKGDHL
jgi:hypothetical protein